MCDSAYRSAPPAIYLCTYPTARDRAVLPPAPPYSAGLGALELFASGMKAMGAYVSRSLSYEGAEFVVEQAEIEPEHRWEGGRRGRRAAEAPVGGALVIAAAALCSVL